LEKKKTPRMMFQNLKSLITKNLHLISILILAAFFRIYRIGDYLTFLGDEGRDVLVVYNILQGDFTLLGPTSSVGGFFLGPIYYYFMAPFLLLFNYNPVGPAVMVALFGVATVWLVYKVTGEIFGRKAAFFASLLYAISPLVVTYSRSSWNPNLMPFFTLFALFLLYKAQLNNKLKYFFGVGLIYGILMQLHYIEFFVGGMIFVYVLISQYFENKGLIESVVLLLKKYSSIALGFLLGISPYIIFEIRHGFVNTGNIIKFIFASPDVSGGENFFAIAYDVFFRVFARLIAAFPTTEHIQNYHDDVIQLWSIGVVLLAVVAIAFLAFRFYRSFKERNPKYQAYLFLIIWLLVGVLLFGFYKKPIYDYYFQFLFPLPFIIVGGLLAEIYSKNFTLKILSLLIFIALILVNLYSIPFKHEPNRQLNQMKSIAQFVVEKADGKPFNFALITGSNSDHAYRYFFTVWNQEPVTIENPTSDPERNSVTEQLFVVCESLPCEPLGHSLWEVAGFGRAEIAEKWNVSVVEVYKLVPYEEAQGN
jgi:4-amino-4-deoxy-L-arabinose transferase-like glycosyltransferase